jgi:hypothetical protein
MSLTVGIILLAIFLAFALAMFFEKLSALLALPLMATCFLLVSAVADTLQRVDWAAAHDPAQESRFARWVDTRHTQLRILHEKAARFDAANRELNDGPADSTVTRTRVAAALQSIAEQERDARALLSDTQRFPPFFARPPLYDGPQAKFIAELDGIAAESYLGAIEQTLADPARAATTAAAVHAAQKAARRAVLDHPSPPDLSSRAFRWSCAGSYIFNHVRLMLESGSMALSGVIMAALFGGMFAVYVRNLKIAERMVYWTAEFAGERPRMICLIVLLVTAVIFSSVGGLGTVIILGTVILPILRSVGLGATTSAGVFLIGIATGGTLQPVSRRLWLDFYRIPADQLDRMLWTMVGLYLICGVIWILWATRRPALCNFDAEAVARPAQPDVPRRLMVAPLIPVLLVYAARVEAVSAFVIALVYMYLCVFRRPGAVRVLSRSLIEGAQMVIPPVLLMIGIGLLVTALMTAPVQGYLKPLLERFDYLVSGRWGYILTFGIAAPLALYRGPLNVWGMGIAVAATLLATTGLPPAAILGAILAAGMLQGICDPTNTANVWIAGFQGVTVNQLLRATIGLVWVFAGVAVIIFGVWFVP